ncbi:MAG: hypothetical protein UU80_C0002G0040 [candidate division WWE3 bacterium GW2011_GWA1_41_8]|uniref:Uncharacterized protein n=1 Tax=candidate division WWE3 bacterium GW2011_GWA1_41_8 TaxID=1619103 RepID=A0A0G1AC01_UNCKA|nr:MAG: hypothetical protein UU80_C0002G0040 [candidate division WWE3 bacterium GW2011_GWA1_41_8]
MSNSDAARWHRRSERFLTAVKSGELKDTYQHYQPGVTLMWLNALVKQSAFTAQLRYTNEPKTLENADYFPVIHGISKAAIVVVLGILFFIQLILINRIFSHKTSLIYGLLLVLEPYLIGIDRWFHLTSLETYFLFTSFLCLVYWYKKFTGNSGKKYLFLAAVLFALAVLSKLTSLSALPTLLLIILFRNTGTDRPDKSIFKKECIIIAAKNVSIFTGVFLVTLFIVFPAFWVGPVNVITKLYDAVVGAVSDDIRGDYFYGVFSMFYYFIIPAFKLSPITLIVFTASLIFFKRTFSSVPRLFSVVLLANLLIVLTVSDKKIDRYIIIMFPSILLICSLFFSSLNRKLITGVFLAHLLVFLYAYLTYYPVFSAFYSPALGGTKKAMDLGIYENSGEYFSDAAFYLNGLGRDKYVYIPNNFESFSYYYKGNIQRDLGETTDYIVASLDFDRRNIEYVQCPVMEKSFGPKNTPVVFIFKCK